MKQTSVVLDLNNPEFLKDWVSLDKAEFNRVAASIKKLHQLSWEQLYKDRGFNWERITSYAVPKGVDAVYSIRITKSCRAIAFRDGDEIRLLRVFSDHDLTYGKK